MSFAARSRIRVEVYLDTQQRDLNKALLNALQADAEAIESEFGAPLEWEALESKRACRIAVYRDGNIDMPSQQLQDIEQWAVDQLLNFKRVLPMHIKGAITELQKTQVQWRDFQ